MEWWISVMTMLSPSLRRRSDNSSSSSNTSIVSSTCSNTSTVAKRMSFSEDVFESETGFDCKTDCSELINFLAVLSGERVSQMTKTYADADALQKLLEEVSYKKYIFVFHIFSIPFSRWVSIMCRKYCFPRPMTYMTYMTYRIKIFDNCLLSHIPFYGCNNYSTFCVDKNKRVM